MDDLLVKFLKKNNINYNDKFVIAVSTGVDSTVLLDLFLNNKLIANDNIIIAHVNHHKRLQSEDEEKYILDFTKRNNLKCYIKDLYFDNEKENFQSVARKKRYEFFNEVMKLENAKYLVLAHHADDLIETILMRIMRGSSLTGYAGINECYDVDGVDDLKYTIIRPLISISKDEIYKYASLNNIKYFEDESNNTNDYQRNKIRHDIIPLLKKEYPNVLDKFYEYSNVLFNASSEIDKIRDNFINDKVTRNNEYFKFSIDEFNKLSDYLKEEVVFELLKPYMLSKANIEEILKVINANKSNYSHNYDDKFELVISYNEVYVYYQPIDKLDINITVDKVGEYRVNDKMKICVSEASSNVFTNKNELWYNYNDLPLTIRSRMPGDKIFINQNYKKVKDVLIDMKVPIKKRDSLLLGVDKDGEVLIIFGIRKSDNLKKYKCNNLCISLKEDKDE